MPFWQAHKGGFLVRKDHLPEPVLVESRRVVSGSDAVLPGKQDHAADIDLCGAVLLAESAQIAGGKLPRNLPCGLTMTDH